MQILNTCGGGCKDLNEGDVRTISRSPRFPGCWFIFVAACTAGWMACSSEGPSRGEQVWDATSLRALALRHRIEVAQSDVFHLILDPDRRRLDLRLRGALLREFRILAVTRPARRIAFFQREDDLSWVTGVHERGRLVPERPVDRTEIAVRPGDPEFTPPPPRIPQPPEEAILAPPTYLIQFDDGLDVVVVSKSSAGEGLDTPDRWVGFLQALGLAPYSGRRLRIILDDADAGALYRSLPADVSLLVVPPGLERR